MILHLDAGFSFLCKALEKAEEDETATDVNEEETDEDDEKDAA